MSDRLTVAYLQHWLAEAVERGEADCEVRVEMEDGVCMPANVRMASFWQRCKDGKYHDVLKVVFGASWQERDDNPDYYPSVPDYDQAPPSPAAGAP